MNVVEPGHIYELHQLDGSGRPLRLVFVNREDNPHEGTQIQEVIRMQIDMLEVLCDRVNHCDTCLRWEGNDHILKHFTESQRQLRLALLLFEQRALERKVDKQGLRPERLPIAGDGHFPLPPTEQAPPTPPTEAERSEFWMDMTRKNETKGTPAPSSAQSQEVG